MNRIQRMASQPSRIHSPYQQLYIYYLKGRLTESIPFWGDHFIGNWEEDGFSFLFFTSPASAIVNRVLNEQSELVLLDSYQMTYEEWQGEALTPMTIGRFHISPPWFHHHSHEQFNIILDPGVVFGTGTHPTTRDCLLALDMAWDATFHNSVIDLGTGTGLLAIAAAKLGYNHIIALDNNGLAAQTASNNVCLNQLESRILVVQGSAETVPLASVDLIIANIHYDVMKHLILSDLFKPHTHFILSGLLRSQVKAVTDMLLSKYADIIRKWDHDGTWYTLFGKMT